jgi:site-specific DNA recombinase
VRERLELPQATEDKIVIDTHVDRVEVHAQWLSIHLRRGKAEDDDGRNLTETVRVPWQKQPSKRRREILLPVFQTQADPRPIRSETRATLIAAIARGRRWLDEIVVDPQTTAETIAQREGCSPRKVNMTVSLAFLSPALVKAALEGRLPRGIGVTRLCDLPAEWSRQHRLLGLNL